VSSPPRTSAREERRLEIRRLVIASLASASAAVIVSQFSVAGTWIAAALTPVFVILIQEALHKPTDVIAERFTSNRTAVLPQGTGAGAPPPARGRGVEAGRHAPPTSAPAEPGAGRDAPEPPLRVYRSGAGGGPRRPRTAKRKLAIGTVAVTAVLAFAIAAFAITGTELITGGSIGKSSHKTTLFGGANTSTTEDQNTNTTEHNQQAPSQQQKTDQQQQKTTPSGSQGQQDNQKTTPAQPGGGGTPTVPVPQTTTP
jgi:hypothetical protein